MARTTSIEIAGVRLALRARPDDLDIALAPPGRRFLVPEGPAPAIEVSVDWLTPEIIRSLQEDGRPVFDSGHLWRLARLGDERVFIFTSPRFGPQPYKMARFSDDFARGCIYLDRRCVRAGVVDPLEYPLDEVLWMHWLPSRQGLILHACGLVADQQSYLFVGQSGAGKTTTARLWQQGGPVSVLSDDRIILLKREGTFWMCGTPWHGEAELAARRSVPVGKVFLLDQANHSRAVDLASAEAVAGLLACSFVPFHDPGALASSVRLMSELVSQVGCQRLAFTRDRTAVEAARGASSPPARAAAAAAAAAAVTSR